MALHGIRNCRVLYEYYRYVQQYVCGAILHVGGDISYVGGDKRRRRRRSDVLNYIYIGAATATAAAAAATATVARGRRFCNFFGLICHY